jgi:hypothetical protein
MAEVTPKTAHQTYQGTRGAVEIGFEMVAMLKCPSVYDYSFVFDQAASLPCCGRAGFARLYRRVDTMWRKAYDHKDVS